MINVVLSCPYVSCWNLAIPVGCPVGCPDIFDQCQFEEHFSCRFSIEKKVGNEAFLQIVVGFRRKPRTLSKPHHFCPLF